MANKISNPICWTPRILSILFVIFLALMSLDVFSPELSFRQTLLALFIHIIPALVLFFVLLVSWKYEVVGGIAYILGGILYAGLVMVSALRNGFQWYYLAWIVQISGIAFVIGALFLIGWFKKKL